MNKIGCIYVPPFLPLDFKYTIFGVFKFSLFIMVWINSTVFEDAKYLSKCRCVTPVCSFHCFNRLVALKNASLVLCSTTKPARGLFIIWFVIISFKVLFVHTLRNSFYKPWCGFALPAPCHDGKPRLYGLSARWRRIWLPAFSVYRNVVLSVFSCLLSYLFLYLHQYNLI